MAKGRETLNSRPWLTPTNWVAVQRPQNTRVSNKSARLHLQDSGKLGASQEAAAHSRRGHGPAPGQGTALRMPRPFLPHPDSLRGQGKEGPLEACSHPHSSQSNVTADDTKGTTHSE